jgi:tripartite ATP-independent transporter DctM subunit
MTLLAIFGVIALALVGAPIFACFAAIALLGAMGLHYNVPQAPADLFGGLMLNVQSLATGDVATTLSTIPLFTFAGYVMAEAKTAERLVRTAQAGMGFIPGGLGIVTILTCAIFTTFTGASGVTIVAIGGLLMPSLIKEGYKEKFALGLVTGTGSVGLLFPPALPIIVYGVIYGLAAQSAQAGSGESLQLISFSIDTFLFAGIVPGAVLVLALVAYAVVVAIRQKVPTTAFEPVVAMRELAKTLPELMIPVIVIGAMATGWLQIPEAAAVTALYVLIVEMALYRDIKARDLPRIARESMGLVGAIFIVIVGATLLTGYFVNARVPDRLYEWMEAYIKSKWTFLLALNVLLLIVGCLMDIFSAIVVVVPLIAPAAARYGVDPYHLGVIFLLNLEIGYLTPPVGLNLFITAFRFQKPIADVVKAAMPFLLVMIGVLILVTYVPQLTVVRDDKKGGGDETDTGPAPDAGAVIEIKWEDGGVWTPARCETAEIKDDALAYAECQAMFTLYAKCNAIEDPTERLLCQSDVQDGKDPFTDEDEGGGESDGEGAGDDAGAGAESPADAGPVDAGAAAPR